MEKLVNNGSFCSAIELDINFSGDAYEEELLAIIDIHLYFVDLYC